MGRHEVGRDAAPAAGRSAGRGWHYAATWLVCASAIRVLFRVRLEGRALLPDGPYLLCFNHQSWADPFILLAVLPRRPRITFFGPKEADLRVGRRNRLIAWSGVALPYRPDKTDLLGATRRVQAVFDGGGVFAIAGEGRIHAGEATLLPLDEGAAFFAQRARLPIVPVALNGTSWLVFGRRLRVGRRPDHGRRPVVARGHACADGRDVAGPARPVRRLSRPGASTSWQPLVSRHRGIQRVARRRASSRAIA